MFEKRKIFCLSIFIFAMITVEICAQIVTDGLISYWSFDHDAIAGEIAKDIWGKHDGKIFGPVQVVDGKIDQGLKFDGEENYVEIADSEDFKISEKAVTIEVWMKIASLPVKHAMIFTKRGTEFMIGINAEGEPSWFFLGDNSVGETNKRLREGIWSHMIWIWDEASGQSFIYLNGEEIENYVTKDKSPDSIAPINIGRDPGTNDPSKYHFDGILDEVRFYDRVLSSTEVKQNFTAKGLAVTRSGKLAEMWVQIKSQ